MREWKWCTTQSKRNEPNNLYRIDKDLHERPYSILFGGDDFISVHVFRSFNVERREQRSDCSEEKVNGEVPPGTNPTERDINYTST